MQYASKMEYINGSEHSELLSDNVKQAMLGIVVKRKGIYSIRKTKPTRTKDEAGQAVFHAFKIARHHANWGDLAAWSEGITFDLMLMSADNRALFDQALSEFQACFKARLGDEYGRTWGL